MTNTFIHTVTINTKPTVLWYVADANNCFKVRSLNNPEINPFTMVEVDGSIWTIAEEEIARSLKPVERLLIDGIMQHN